MPKIRYTGNPVPEDWTNRITLVDDEQTGEPRVLVRGGDAVEVSGQELRSIAANGYQFEEVKEGEEHTSAEVSGDASPTSDPSSPSSPTSPSPLGAGPTNPTAARSGS